MFALAGLAIFASLQGALEQAFGANLRFGALVAFAVAAPHFAFVGITSAFWAVVVGIIASLVAERGELLELWDNQSDQARKEVQAQTLQRKGKNSADREAFKFSLFPGQSNLV